MWVKNVESKHGNPPEKAAKKVFQRALQHCDPKKLHLALLQSYEDTKQDNLADELLKKMTKKFKKSCKVWLKRIQWLLKQAQDGVQPVVTSAILSLDQIKLGDVDATRALFERAISLSLPPKKIKSLFKKYLEYEKAHGDEGRIEHVKDKAMDYVKHI